MTYQELRERSKDGEKEKRQYIRGVSTKVNLLKMKLMENLPIKERKRLKDEEWKDYLRRNKNRNFYYDNLTYRLEEEYHLEEAEK